MAKITFNSVDMAKDLITQLGEFRQRRISNYTDDHVELLIKVLAAPARDISVTIDQKEHYDGDDMKVSLNGSQLTAIGKTLLPQKRGRKKGKSKLSP